MKRLISSPLGSGLCVLLVAVTFLASCGGGVSTDIKGTARPTGGVTITGVVTADSDGVNGVTVSAAGEDVQTDLNGFFEFKNAPVPADGRLLITFAKSGYATHQRSVAVKAGKTYAMAAALLRNRLGETLIGATQARFISAEDSQGSVVSLALVDGSVANTNRVKVNIAAGDPSTAAGREVFPGDFMAIGVAGGAPNVSLESVAYAAITMIDEEGGTVASLAKPATLTIRLPAVFQSGGARAGDYVAGDVSKGFIPWWSYDETNGAWVREDAEPATPEFDDATVIADDQGILFVRAKVAHLSWWSAGQPITEQSCLCVRVLDKKGSPLMGVPVIAAGATYDALSAPAFTNIGGHACVNVKRSIEAHGRERVKLFAAVGTARFPYDVTAEAGEGDADLDEVFTPQQQRSTAVDSAQCTSLANDLVVRMDGRVRGQVTDRDGNPQPDFILNSDIGTTTKTDTLGRYSLDVPVALPVRLFAPGRISATATVTDTANSVIQDLRLPNLEPQIVSLNRAPQGVIGNSQRLQLGVLASDGDGDGLNYVWSASTGTLDNPAAADTTWTAPDIDDGAATISVKITDGHGGEADRSLSVIWGDILNGGPLRIVLRDNPGDDLPVSGATVALHAADGTIAQEISSDADGVADFGEIATDRATFSILRQIPAGVGNRNIIRTFVDVSVGNVFYYLDDGGLPGAAIPPGLPTPEAPCTTPVDVTVYLQNVPADAVTTRILPFNTEATGTTIPVTVCAQALQKDNGLFSLLAVSTDVRGAVVGYGFLDDRTLTPGAGYVMVINRLPNPVAWQTTPGSFIDFRATVFKGGVAYPGDALDRGESGMARLIDAFPVDYYWFSGEGRIDETRVMGLRRFDTLPHTIDLPMPDYVIGDAGFDVAENTFHWSVTGKTPRDAVILTLSATSAGGNDHTDWRVQMNEEATAWKIPTLPSLAQGWINMGDTSTWMAAVEARDYDFVAGANEFWSFTAHGGVAAEKLQQFFEAYRIIQGPPVP